MPRDYWQSCKEFLPGFSWRAGGFLFFTLVAAVDAWELIEPYVPFEIDGLVSPWIFWSVIGLGFLWAAVATYHQKASELVEAVPEPAPRVEAAPSEPEPSHTPELVPSFPLEERDSRRAKKLREWRKAAEESSGRSILHTPEWSQMRVYLDEEVVKDVEGTAGISIRPALVFGGRDNPTVKQRILDGLAELEQRWGLLE